MASSRRVSTGESTGKTARIAWPVRVVMALCVLIVVTALLVAWWQRPDGADRTLSIAQRETQDTVASRRSAPELHSPRLASAVASMRFRNSRWAVSALFSSPAHVAIARPCSARA